MIKPCLQKFGFSLDRHTHGAGSVDQNRRSDPTSAYLVAPRKEIARCPMRKDSCGVHEGRVDTFCNVASRTPTATTYTARSTGVSVGRSR